MAAKPSMGESLAGECLPGILSISVRRVTESTVVGRLKACLPFWRDTLKANSFVLDIIEKGYTIPFVVEPPPHFGPNNKSARDHAGFVAGAIEKLLLAGVVRENSVPYCCSSLTVAIYIKLRLALHLSRHVNLDVLYQHFKFEDWFVAEQFI
jgi:hypothetical protein